MVKADHAARAEEARNRNCCRTFCMCGCLVDVFKFWESKFGFTETEQELEMLLAGVQYLAVDLGHLPSSTNPLQYQVRAVNLLLEG